MSEAPMSATQEAQYRHISRVSLGDIIHRSALRWPEKTALVEGELEFSYAELDRRSNAFAHYLLAQGLPRGARIAMLCGNSAQMVSDSVLCVLPMFHCAQHAVSMSFLLAGATVVVRRAFEPGAMLATVEQHGITLLMGLPIMYGAMLAHPARPTTKLSSLRLCLYVMAPMARTLLVELIEKFCPGGFALASGQTEMYPATTLFKPEQQLKRFGSYWGDPVVTNETAIMDDEGRLLGRGEVGEIVHRGPNVMLGYYKDPEATARARAFGWHHTGDLGMFDADGQLLFVDRKKDMIKTGGENVPSIKVEEVLLRHPALLQVAVVGLPHPHWSEAVTGFVVLKPGASATEADLIAHCRQHLGGFEVPKSIVLLPAMPQTTTGKAQKFVLRQQYERHYQAHPSA